MRNYRKYLLLFVVLAIFGMANISVYDKKSQSLDIRINKYKGRSFVSENEIKKYIETIRAEHPEVLMQGSFQPGILEESLRSLDYVKEAQVSKDIAGRLVVDIEQEAPLARVISSKGGFYITDEVRLLPLSQFYTPRVVVITGRGADSLAKASFLANPEGIKFINFLFTIDKDAFWKAQITQIEFTETFEVRLHTLVGNHTVELGRLENLDIKFDKISQFYSKIIPSKGWQAYKKVKVQFDGQIVCE